MSPMAGASILIVDDEAANVLLLRRIVEFGGAEAVTTTDPREAVDLCMRCQPDLILLDLHMPGVDGYELLGSLREALPEGAFVPVIVITADATYNARHRALSLGATDFLTKPFDREEVTLRIGNLLKVRHLHRSLEVENEHLAADLRIGQERERLAQEDRALRLDRIRPMLQGVGLRMVFQPIVRLGDGAVLGAEALARFDVEPLQPPDVWFAEAAVLGLGVELELAAVHAAIQGAHLLEAPKYLSVNASPAALVSGRLATLADLFEPSRLVVELTEHVVVDDYEEIAAALEPLRRRGVRLAVDDAGSGYASLTHILRLRPDIIKVDLSLTRGVEIDAGRRSLVIALVQFASEIGATLVAEGIENREAMDTLADIGVGAGQGFFLAKPGPLPLPRIEVFGARV